MKNFLLFFTTIVIILTSALSAQELNVPSAPKPYRASTKSSFSRPENNRNPFWPVGFVPRQKTLTDEQLLRIPVEQFKVTAIILDVPSIAVINGKDYTQGEFLPLKTATGTAKILITKIEDGMVTVQYKDKTARIPISRK